MYDVTQLKEDLAGILHGTTLDQITNLDNLIYRAARQVLMDLDPQETKRIVQLPDPLYNQVWDYPSPADLKGTKIIDIRPQVNRPPWDQYAQVYNKPFDLIKQGITQQFTVNFNTGLKTIRANNPQLQVGVVLNTADTTDGSGTWTTFGDANNLTVDNVNFAAGSGSLQFDLTFNTGIGGLENSTIYPINLSAQENQANEFFYVYLPTASQFTSINLAWGSSTTDYWSKSTTVTQQNTVFVNGWNLLQVPWLGATVTGSPDASSISYLKVTYSYTATQTAVRLNNIVSRLGQIMEMEYYSKYLFRDSITGAFQETVTNDSNIINLDTETYNVMTYQCAYLAVQQQAGAEGGSDLEYFGNLYTKCLNRYKSMYKSEYQKPSEIYYSVQNSQRYGKWIGQRPWN